MKRFNSSAGKPTSISPQPAHNLQHSFPRLLILIILGLVLIIITGTIYGFTRSQDASPLFRIGKSGEPEQTDSTFYDNIQIFTGIGRLRIPLTNSSTMVLSISFPYFTNDYAFTEELAAKIADFRTIAINYFSSVPAEELTPLNEEIAKTEILRAYNTALRLGRIEALYFHDMIIIE
jgi:flagellar basal body-associated protein FliL